MRNLAKIRADLEGPIAALAITLRRLGKSESEVEAVTADLFRIHDAGARRALKRLLASSLFAQTLRRELDDEVFDEELSVNEMSSLKPGERTEASEYEYAPLRLAADPGRHSTKANDPSEGVSRPVKRVIIGGRPFDLTLGFDDDIVLSGVFEPAWQALEAEGVRYELREDAGPGRRRVEGLGRNGFDLAEVGAAASRPRFVI